MKSLGSSECRLVSVSNILPVGNFPDGLDVIRPYVLVLKVVGVFPHVDTEQWHQPSARLEWVLTQGNRQTSANTHDRQKCNCKTVHKSITALLVNSFFYYYYNSVQFNSTLKQDKVGPRRANKASSIQYGYRNWGTHARVFCQTFANGSCKNEIR